MRIKVLTASAALLLTGMLALSGQAWGLAAGTVKGAAKFFEKAPRQDLSGEMKQTPDGRWAVADAASGQTYILHENLVLDRLAEQNTGSLAESALVFTYRGESFALLEGEQHEAYPGLIPENTLVQLSGTVQIGQGRPTIEIKTITYPGEKAQNLNTRMKILETESLEAWENGVDPQKKKEAAAVVGGDGAGTKAGTEAKAKATATPKPADAATTNSETTTGDAGTTAAVDPYAGSPYESEGAKPAGDGYALEGSFCGIVTQFADDYGQPENYFVIIPCPKVNKGGGHGKGGGSKGGGSSKGGGGSKGGYGGGKGGGGPSSN